jgi:5-methylcytosine-specific restriction endonuclease McrA
MSKIGSKEKRRRYRSLLDRDGDNCFWCFERFSDENPYTLEHMTPIVRGGSNSLENLVLACFWCNGKRSDMPAIEFREWLHENWIPLSERKLMDQKAIRKAVQARKIQQAAKEEEGVPN